LKHYRLFKLDGTDKVPVSTVDMPISGWQVHGKGFGFIRVFRNGNAEYWVTSDLSCRWINAKSWRSSVWMIEYYHRSRKQDGSVARTHVHSGGATQPHAAGNAGMCTLGTATAPAPDVGSMW
jgi:hypothetical protein